MENELLNISNDKELKITSVELVELINQFRELESKATGKKYIELQHKSFMEKIRNEVEVLKTVGLIGEQNILLGSYLDKQNQERPCYSLNRDGMLQMLNSESAIVRAKTIQYINKLEENIKLISAQNEIKELKSTINDLKQSTEEAKRMYKPSHKKKLDYNRMINRLVGDKEDAQVVKELVFAKFNFTKWEDACIEDNQKILEAIMATSRIVMLNKYEQISVF